MAAVFNHIFVYLQALLREKDPETRILLTMYPMSKQCAHSVPDLHQLLQMSQLKMENPYL